MLAISVYVTQVSRDTTFGRERFSVGASGQDDHDSLVTVQWSECRLEDLPKLGQAYRLTLEASEESVVATSMPKPATR